MPLSLKDIHHQSCRDLWSVMHAPMLLTNCNNAPYHVLSTQDLSQILKKGQAPFERLLHEPQPLIEYLSQRRQQRLGHYFEDLVIYWIRELAAMPCLSHIQFNENKRTLGECDLMVEVNGQWQWWEMTVKFYCLDRDPSDSSHWCGIRSHDRLSIKYDHMMQHQLPLSKHPYVATVLKEKGIEHPDAVSASIFAKGYLFVVAHEHEKYLTSAQALSPIINPHVTIGWSLRSNQGDALPRSRASSRYIRIPHMQWIAPVLREPRSDELLSWNEMKKNLDALHRDQQNSGECMIAELLPQSDGYWTEHSRGCILPLQWPKKT